MPFQFPAWIKNDNKCWLRDLPKHRQIQRIIDVYRLKMIYENNLEMTRNQAYESFLEFINKTEIDIEYIELLKLAFDDSSDFYILKKGLTKDFIQSYYKKNKIMFEMIWLETVLENLFEVNVY